MMTTLEWSLNISAHLNAKSPCPNKRSNLIIVKRGRHRSHNRQCFVWILDSHHEQVGSLGGRDVNAESEDAALHHEIWITLGSGLDLNVAGRRVGLVPSQSQQHLTLKKKSHRLLHLHPHH